MMARMMRKRISDEDRFWLRVDVMPRDGSDCWLYQGRIDNPWGYGRFDVNDRGVFAHRFAWELENGAVPQGFTLDHRPECPKNCVNPVHLRIATVKQQGENRGGAQSNSKSGIRGVYYDPVRNGRKNPWRGDVRHNGKTHYVGRFPTSEKAEAAVIAKRNELFTHNDLDRRSSKED